MLQNFSGFSGAVNAVRFYPDGKHVITAHSDGSLQHWQTFDVLLTDDAAARISPEVLRAAGLSVW